MIDRAGIKWIYICYVSRTAIDIHKNEAGYVHVFRSSLEMTAGYDLYPFRWKRLTRILDRKPRYFLPGEGMHGVLTF